MRFLAAALALLLVGVASADIQLTNPGFIKGKTHTYDVWINITSAIPGMSPQVSKTATYMQMKMYAIDMKNVYVTFNKCQVSNSVPSVGSRTDQMKMETNSDYEQHMTPFKFTYENGKVISYTLDKSESVESRKIKKACLRQFEVHIEKHSLTSTSHERLPITYNLTRTSPVGNYISHYIITSSPYADFPIDRNVINITRTDNYEGIPYLTYHTHHNFEQQGCPGVCKIDQVENRFKAGCPAEWEPYQTPMKKSFVQHHNLREFEQGKTFYVDSVDTKETHVADIYDQKMEVAIQTSIRHKHISSTPIPEPTGQTTYTDLHEWIGEVNEEEINRHCKYTTAGKAIPTVKELLKSITEILLKGTIDGEGTDIGEKLVLLQKGLALLKRRDLEKIQEEIPTHEDVSKASEEDKIKRQIWLENLPLIGTADSISFIVDLIKKSVNDKHHGIISLWEAKVILDAMPLNILSPNAQTIQKLSELPEVLQDRKVPGYGMYYSSAHMAVARVIRKICADSNGIPEGEKDTRPNYLQNLLREADDDYKNSKCPKAEVKKYIKDVVEKMKGNEDRLKRIIYIEALSQTGIRSVIPILKRYVEGRIRGLTPSDMDFTRSVAIHALYNLVQICPEEIKHIVLPIYSNKTEAPKIRTAAFGVFVKSNPTLGDLQLVAELTWSEPSEEVGSYVTSTLESTGNSSIPCDQLIASRIKKVLPQVKRYANGKQRAQNILTTSFDEIRRLGIEHRFEFTPSNESFFPSTFYTALGYNADALRDMYFECAANSEGFNSLNTWDNFLRYFKLKVADGIPKSMESQIFPEVEMADRANEFWRFTIFEKLFYSMSYYYMDDAEYQNGDILSLLKRHFKNYFKWERNGHIHGHLVKLWLPSSYQSKAFAQTLPYPVKFEMRNPMLFSLNIKAEIRDPGFSVDARPTYYHSMLYSNEMLNLGDCKEVGVYHEKKIAFTNRFKFNLALEDGKVLFSYSFPELEKKIFNYQSEAGTYAKKYTLAVQPSSKEREVIKTIPAMFKRNNTLKWIGSPILAINVLTEDMSLGYEEIPRSHVEAMSQFTRYFLNAGWRRKHIEIYQNADSHMWGPRTEVKMYFTYLRSFVKSKRQVKLDDSWINAINFDEHDENNYSTEERAVIDKVRQVSHLHDSLSISVEHKVNERVSNKAHLQVVYNRTLEGLLHSFYVKGNATVSGVSFGAITKAAALFTNRPNEFNYGDGSYGNQKGVIIGSLWFPGHKSPRIAAKVLLQNKPLEYYINKELQTPLSAKYFYPETHEQCLQDVQSGNVDSVACLRAIPERSIYNEGNMKILWKEDIHPVIEEIISKCELAVRHTYFKHLSIETKQSSDKKVEIYFKRICKLTNVPVVDVVVTKPTEVMKFQKVDISYFLPISSIYRTQDTYLQHYTNNTYPATCTLMKKSVRTYDLKTIRLPRDKNCSYILTTHCVRNKKFAVIARIDSEKPESREIHIYIGRHSIILTPPTGTNYVIKYDNQSHTVNYLQPIMLHETEKIYAFTNKFPKGSSFIEIHGEKAGIIVKYDGQYVKTQVHPRYKGELCGLCSEFNGEVVRELRGPNGCLFSHVDDYTTSCALGSCYNPKASNRAICSNDDYSHTDISDQDVHENKRE